MPYLRTLNLYSTNVGGDITQLDAPLLTVLMLDGTG